MNSKILFVFAMGLLALNGCNFKPLNQQPSPSYPQSNSPSGNSSQDTLKRPPIARPPSTPSPASKITLYGTQSCGGCRYVRKILSQQGIKFRDVDLDSPNGGQEFNSSTFFNTTGYREYGLPVMLVCNQWMEGWDENKFKQLIASCR